ncbi:helix-turn-helix domain-containing protein [Crocinitomix catalasitica]|uniref:helix-turn-helix domain-containing protein n=1 Tax=Crocinitomix catalasitica TaxID=184607 RepID=UPI000688DA78|nr:AraC family transcriptional regulator [Crocinitomix catalasitica]
MTKDLSSLAFQSQIGEIFTLTEFCNTNFNVNIFNTQDRLSIIWNTGDNTLITIDSIPYKLEKNCCLFLTEFHIIDDYNFDTLKIIQFNRLFYCINDNDSEVGCKGLLFYNGTNIPKIQIPKENAKQFNLIWELLQIEIQENDNLQVEMLQTLLKRFLILSLRILKTQEFNLESNKDNLNLIRTFNYLVEKHFKEYSKVSDYAKLLNKSPKTLSNTFKKNVGSSPLQIISNRRLLEAKRMLKHQDISIKEIAFNLGFIDLQTFSHFFKKLVGTSPKEFKSQFNQS